MTRAQTIATILIAAATGLGAYTATVQTRPAGPPPPAADPATEALLNWLGASPAQRNELRMHDAGFAVELKQLKADVEAKRNQFASALEQPKASNDEIMSRLEAVLAANNALERRIAGYLLSVRDHLTPEQRQRLFGLCAEEARQGRQWRGGRGPGATTRPGERQGPGGRGWRGGRGRGGGQ